MSPDFELYTQSLNNKYIHDLVKYRHLKKKKSKEKETKHRCGTQVGLRPSLTLFRADLRNFNEKGNLLCLVSHDEGTTLSEDAVWGKGEGDSSS